MKKLIALVGCALFVSISYAQNAPSVGEITKNIIRSVNAYGNAISCPNVNVTPKDIAALVPHKTFEDRDKAMYAVLWAGDIGCLGGSGTETPNIAIVTVSTGDTYVVQPHLSSPAISFEGAHARSFPKIVGNNKDSIVVDGFEYDPQGKDAMCCPSVPVRITVRVDEKGNWKNIEKKQLPLKK
jgi:hypothetical protein